MFFGILMTTSGLAGISVWLLTKRFSSLNACDTRAVARRCSQAAFSKTISSCATSTAFVRLSYSERRCSHPERHQHIERVRPVAIHDDGRRAGIGELNQRRVAGKLLGDFQQITRVEADLDGGGIVIDLDLLGRRAGIRVVD